MIINSTEHTVNGVTFNQITSENSYWGVAYNDDLTVAVSASGNPVLTIPQYDEEGSMVGGWIQANTVTDGLSNGFGADTFDELWEEIKNRGIIIPQNILSVLLELGFE